MDCFQTALLPTVIAVRTIGMNCQNSWWWWRYVSLLRTKYSRWCGTSKTGRNVRNCFPIVLFCRTQFYKAMWDSSRSPYSKGGVWRTGSLCSKSALITLIQLKHPGITAGISVFDHNFWLRKYISFYVVCLKRTHSIKSGHSCHLASEECITINKNTPHFKDNICILAETVMGRSITWAWERQYKWYVV